MKKCYPTGKRILVKKAEAKEKSAGGIIIPPGAREMPQVATILELGPDVGIKREDPRRDLRKLRLAVGDEVVFASFAATKFTIDDEEVLVVDEDDIMLVLQEEPDDP